MSNGVHVKEASGVVMIFGLASQPVAIQLCDRMRKKGIKSTIGILPSIPGYQVSIHEHSVTDVKGILDQLGIHADVTG